jgi:membrane-bound ClpP family serine protease
MSEPAPPVHTTTMPDPVRARRLVVARWTKLANRIGYLLFLVAIVTFVLGFFLGFSGVVATIVTVSMVIGSILLAPALVLGYAVKAAEREDRERGL